jgi:chitinase
VDRLSRVQRAEIPGSTGGKLDIGRLPPRNHIWRYKPTLKTEFPVPNPKEIFQQARPNIIRLQSATEAARLEMMMSMYSDGDTTDAARVHSVPTFFASQAIEQMETVREVGKEVAGKERTDLILTVLSAVFAVVPFIGELGVMAAGLATLARIISVVGLAANTALTVTDAIEHPETAPLAVMGLLLGGLPGSRGVRPKAPRENCGTWKR